MAAAPEGPEPAPAPGQLYRLAWVLYLLLGLAGVVWLGVRHRVIPLELFVEPAEWWLDLGLGVGAGLLLLGFWEALRHVVPLARELEESIARVLASVDPAEAVALAVLSGFAEEVFFRGALQGAFTWLPWLWSALFFSVLHTGSGRAFRLWTLFAFVAGLVLGLLMYWRGNLLGPVTAHVLVNAVSLSRIARRGVGAGEGEIEEEGEERGEEA